MKAEELRIGNYVYPPDNDHTLWEIAIDDFYYFYGGLNRFDSKPQPIPLTEQWMLDFGLRINRLIDNSYRITIDSEFGYCMSVITADGSKEIEFAHFHNVHQLQNLYFSLSGKELTLKK